MSVATHTQRDAIRGMLADLKMPGSLEAVDSILSEIDGGRVAATEAISQLLAAQITLRNNRRLQTAMRSSRLPAVWRAWRRHDSGLAQPAMLLPLVLAASMLSVLAAASDSRDLYLIPLMLPLSLLAAQGIGDLPRMGTVALSEAAR